MDIELQLILSLCSLEMSLWAEKQVRPINEIIADEALTEQFGQAYGQLHTEGKLGLVH